MATLKENLDARVLKLQEKEMINNAKDFWNELKNIFLNTSTSLLAGENGYTIEVIIKKDSNGSVLYQLPSDKNYYEFNTNCSAQSVKFAADNFAKAEGITVKFEKKNYYSFKFTYKL